MGRSQEAERVVTTVRSAECGGAVINFPADMRLVRNLRRRRFPARWVGEIFGR